MHHWDKERLGLLDKKQMKHNEETNLKLVAESQINTGKEMKH